MLGIEPSRFADPYFARLLHGVQSEAFDAGYEVLLLKPQAPVPWHKMDALLLASTRSHLLADKPALLPCVSLLYQDSHLPSVVVDDFAGVRQATERLIDLGHERIAYLSLSEHPITRRRIAGYQSALRDAGLAASPAWLRAAPARILEQEIDEQHGDPRRHFREWGYRTMQEWLQDDWGNIGCTALLAQNDHVAVGALAAFGEAGVRVPGDVSLVGFDDSAFCECTSPTLSSIAAPLFEVGAVGVRSLLRELDTIQHGASHRQSSSSIEDTVILPAHLQVRDSIAAVA